MRSLLPLLLVTLLCTCARAQQVPLLTEQLGYPTGTKLLIVHADDLAVTHSTNVASMDALERGTVSSASVMAPCPWLPEVAEYARANPNHDLGMHLTLTSEWRLLRWGPVAPAGQVPSLIDSAGYFYPRCEGMLANARPEEVEIELRAQVERARELGLNPTHLDSHMGCLFRDERLFEAYLRVARDYGIPAMVGRNEAAGRGAEYTKSIKPDDLVVDRVLTAVPGDYTRGMESFYRTLLDQLEPGVSVVLIHTALDGLESEGMAGGIEGWGNRWRQLDYNFFTSAAAREQLEREGIQLMTWRELAERWQNRGQR